MKFDVQPGSRIGRWIVVEKSADAKWKCRCDCGSERLISDRGLRYGGSLSCGCLRRDMSSRKNTRDLTGQRFGNLTVVEKSGEQPYAGRSRWKCRCECGKYVTVPGNLLTMGKKTGCGCENTKKYPHADITGRKFARLTALYPVPGRTSQGGMIWRCRCECGNETDVSYNNLVHAGMKSCGCLRREHDMQLAELLPHVDGTSIFHLRSKKTPANNTTGVRGVYRINGKFTAKIVFQKKQYILGTFEQLEDAANARRKAEAMLHDGVVDFYERWKARAENDAAWAEDNPIRINVEREGGSIRVNMLPRI